MSLTSHPSRKGLWAIVESKPCLTDENVDSTEFRTYNINVVEAIGNTNKIYIFLTISCSDYEGN